MNRLIIVLVILYFPCFALAQIIQSNGTGGGLWNAPTSWQGGIPPTSVNSTQIIVKTGDIINVPNGFSVDIDQTTIQGNAVVNILSGGLLNIKNQPGGGGGNELTIFNNGVTIGHLIVFGILELDHNAAAGETNGITTTNTTSTTLSIESGGTYRHRYRGVGGIILGANFKDGSTVEFKDFTSLSSIPTNFDQSYYNFVWDCPGQTNILSFGSSLKTIRGNCTINSTGSGKFRFFGQFSNNTLSIGGTLTVGSAAVMAFSANGTNNVATIGGSFVYNSGSISPLAESGNCTLTVTGNIDIMNPVGEFRLASGTGSTSTINLAGNLSVLGTMRTTSNGITTLNFNGTSQTYSVTGTMDGEINFNILSPADVDLGISALKGTGSLLLSNGAKLRVGSFNGSGTDNNGAIQNSTTQGNIRLPGAKRSYISGSTIIYSGTQAQRIGNGHPTTPGVVTELDCPNGITLVNNTTIPGDLLIDNNCGDLNLATRNLTMNGANFTINTPVWSTLGTGTFYFNGNTIMGGTGIPTFRNVRILAGASVVFPSSQMDIYGDFTVISPGSFNANGGTVRFFGAGDRSLGPNGGSFHNMIVDKASGTLTAGSAFTVSNSLTLSSGTLSAFGTGQLTLGNGSQMNLNSAANMTGVAPLGGPYALTYSGTSLSTSNEAKGSLSSLTVNTSATVTLTSNISMTGALIVNSGTFTSGANAISLGQLTNLGTFNAPSINLTISGNLTNNGTLNHNGGTIDFIGTTSILGTSPSLNNIVITGSLTPLSALDIKGNFTNNGTFNEGVGTVNFTGSSTQNISGTTSTDFYDISVLNSSTPSVYVETSSNLFGTLNVGANSDFDADGTTNSSVFTLISSNDSPTSDASIAALLSGATITGKVTAQRYMSAEGTLNRYLSSPVTNAEVSQWQDDFSITGDKFTGTSFPCTGCLNNGESLKRYDETVQGVSSKGYKRYPLSTNTELLEVGRGYLAYMWDGASQITWDLTGPVNQGTIPLPVTYTLSAPALPNDDGWNLVGNPYPSTIQWTNALPGWSVTNIDPIVYVNDNASGVFRFWDAQFGVGDLTNGLIAMGQAFWIKANGPGAALSIHEQSKSSSVTGSFFRSKSNLFENIKISISDGRITDNSFIVFSESASSGYDVGFDKIKPINPNLFLAIAGGGELNKRLAVDARSEISNNESIPLIVSMPGSGQYSLSFANNGYAEFNDLFLIDKSSGMSVALSSGSYSYYANGNELIQDRFEIRRGGMEDRGDFRFTLSPNPTADKVNVISSSKSPVMVSLINSSGQLLLSDWTTISENLNKLEVDLSEFSKGIYLIRVQSNTGFETKKLVKH